MFCVAHCIALKAMADLQRALKIKKKRADLPAAGADSAGKPTAKKARKSTADSPTLFDDGIPLCSEMAVVRHKSDMVLAWRNERCNVFCVRISNVVFPELAFWVCFVLKPRYVMMWGDTM